MNGLFSSISFCQVTLKSTVSQKNMEAVEKIVIEDVEK